ncbi:cytochrome P450 709B2 [Hevea brasiliensis]|uniref:cytochrome P450 709B2 n=1 Tax=Hevea brasiliensis TaxID=3981 RepID=UPI0025FFCD98|nr:cytochrome P450 709B2 [Hevea brasiliensis]
MAYVGILMVAFTFLLLLLPKIWQVVKICLWRPYALSRSFGKQGVKGPSYSFFSGSLNEMKRLKMDAAQIVLDTTSNDITPRVLPQYHKWCPRYGETILYWFGTRPVVCITDPDLAKQILSNKFGFYVKPKCSPAIQALTGNGVALVNGLEWVRRRRIVNPAFSVDKLKVMVKRMATCSISMLEEWKNEANAAVGQCRKIEINGEFRKLTAAIIAHTAFGSSYSQGEEAFEAQNELQHYCAASFLDVFIPGSHYLPTPSKVQLWKLDRRVKNSLRDIIKSRLNSCNPDCNYGDDLLGLIIAASENSDSKEGPKLSMDEIVEECKTFFFAGHETSSNLLTWTVFLLSIHQDWQTRLREEVLKECGMGVPDSDMLARLRLATMVLLEALRLYCPVVEMFREASKDMKLGNLTIPKDALVSIPLAKIHRSKEYWGEDANEFNPIRFKNGISKAAKHPNAFLAFGIGPRTCVGQNFAMLEAKAVLAMVLQRFTLSLSSEYKHAPVDNLALQPQYGLPIVVKPLSTQAQNI